MSRYDINRKVKVALVRNAVDLAQLKYSCTATNVHLWGFLNKDPEGDFTPTGVERLLKDVSRLPEVRHVRVDIENWDIQSGDGGWIITGKKKKQSKQSEVVRSKPAGAGTEKILEVDKVESVKKVLDDLVEKKKSST